MARICEEPSTPSFGGEEDDPASDLLGDEGEKVLEAFLDSALENDPVLRGILNEGLTQIIKAAIRLLNLQRRRDKGQSQGHSREDEEKGPVQKSKVSNAMNRGDPEGPGGNLRIVEEGQGTSLNRRDNNSASGTMTPAVNSLSAEGKGTLEERHHDHELDLVGGISGSRLVVNVSEVEDGDVGEELPSSEGGLKKMNAGVEKAPPGKRRKVTSKHCCYFCLKNFPALSLLERHMTTHTQEKPFPCPLCGQEFSEKGNLDRHIRFHRKETRFKCNFCGKDFVEKATLEDHIRRHLKEKYYKCLHPGCTSSFVTEGELKSHAKVHSREKHLKCNLCGKWFSHQGNLNDHIRRHLKEKYFKCPHPDCTSSFVGATELKKHSRVHTGEKPFPCPYPNCGKQFARKNVRDGHHRLHTGEKPFACGCGQTFASSSGLRIHRKKCEEVPKRRKMDG